MNDYEKNLLANIEEHGWFCVSVFGDGKRPPWSYSVGFTKTLAAPEFAIFGMAGEMAHAMLWELFRAVKDGAPVPNDGERVPGILKGYDCIARAVHPDHVVRENFNSAMWYWRDQEMRNGPVAVRQLFWPEVGSGLFPWEPGCGREVRAGQPSLFQPRRAPGLASRLRGMLGS